MNRGDLTNRQWEKLEPLLPKSRRGRPREDDRRIVNGILWVLRTGAPWRDLPERYGPWSTVHTRFRRWREAGVWEAILAAVQSEADEVGELDWEVHFVDGSVVRAHQHAAGVKKASKLPRPSDAAEAGSVPKSISVPKAGASR
jgi:transposase